MKKEDYYFDLPQELIAQQALASRDQSRLMVIGNNPLFEHKKFYDLPSYLCPGDLLLLNDTKVMPARLMGRKIKGDQIAGEVEILLLHRLQDDLWETIVRPGKRCRPGDQIVFPQGELRAEIKEILPSGNRTVEFSYQADWEEILAANGLIPLPPYIKEELKDKDSYQTVYAENTGSSAAPTAGLHFTQELLEQIRQLGVEIASITLHVGLGTFRPVKAEDLRDHKMHSEYYLIKDETAAKINDCINRQGRIIAVGTTSCRVLETIYKEQSFPYKASSGWTDIFIYPGFKFGLTDLLVTNFHLPESTLLMLVSAFVGREVVLAAYREAIAANYRFFSFGDAMLLIPEVKNE